MKKKTGKKEKETASYEAQKVEVEVELGEANSQFPGGATAAVDS